MIGNVHVPPIVPRSQVASVLTDLGEVKVFDVGPQCGRSTGFRVSLACHLSMTIRTSTEMTVSGTSMWISGIRVGRFQLQINTGRVVRKWSKTTEYDQFIGKPFAGDDTLVHARILRDLLGDSRYPRRKIKTRAMKIWSTDVGVPIAMLKPAQERSDSCGDNLGRNSLKSTARRLPADPPNRLSKTSANVT